MPTMFTKILLSLALLASVATGFSGVVFAQDMLFFGQKHSYTVTFRDNGEAITSAKLVVPNPEERLMTEFSFEIPGVSPTELTIYQGPSWECVSYGTGTSILGSIPGMSGDRCTEYRDPYNSDSYYNYYGSDQGRYEYKKIEYARSGNFYRFSLPTPVEPHNSTTLVVTYAAKGYVSERVGLHTFRFETIKVPARIKEVKVAVDLDADLLLKGQPLPATYKKGSVGWNPVPMPEFRDMNTIVRAIGSSGLVVKKAGNLAPYESFIVRGEYAADWPRLYLSSILFSVFAFTAFFVAIYFFARFLKKRGWFDLLFGGATDRQAVSHGTQSSVGILNPVTVLVSLFSVSAIIGLTYAVSVLSNSDPIRLYARDPILDASMMIAVLLLYLFVLFVPPAIVAARRGWRSFVSILIADFLWLAIFLTMSLLLFLSFFGSVADLPRGL